MAFAAYPCILMAQQFTLVRAAMAPGPASSLALRRGRARRAKVVTPDGVAKSLRAMGA